MLDGFSDFSECLLRRTWFVFEQHRRQRRPVVLICCRRNFDVAVATCAILQHVLQHVQCCKMSAASGAPVTMQCNAWADCMRQEPLSSRSASSEQPDLLDCIATAQHLATWPFVRAHEIAGRDLSLETTAWQIVWSDTLASWHSAPICSHSSAERCSAAERSAARRGAVLCCEIPVERLATRCYATLRYGQPTSDSPEQWCSSQYSKCGPQGSH